VAPTAKPTPPPSARPTPAPTPSNSAKPSPKPSVTPTPQATKKALAITPPKTGTDKSKTAVTVQNLLPGQKIKVTIVEGNSLPSAQATPKTTTKASPKATTKASPKPSAGGFKTTSKAPVKVVPKPSGSSAGVGINNLKPGQKIKVTIKTGGTKK
jgi:cold shock CspA family protein